MRFHLIDALRGVAAAWVVLYHTNEGGHVDGLYQALPGYVAYCLFDMGVAGVPIFFVISGFVIAHSITKDRVDGKYLAKFTLRRSVRLDPPYWGSIVLAVLVGCLSSLVKHEPVEFPQFQTIIAHVFYAQDFFELQGISVIYWTLCLEIQFYLFFCFLVYIAQYGERFYKHFQLCLFSFAVVISLLWPTGLIKENLLPGLFLPLWYAFLLGAFAYWSWHNKIYEYILYGFLAVVLLSVFLTPLGVGHALSSGSDFAFFSSMTAILVFLCARFGYIGLGNWRWLQFLGLISYSLYLTHNLVTGASFYLIYRFLGDSIWVQAFAFLLTISGCIAFAYLFWLAFESWSIRLSKRVRLKK